MRESLVTSSQRFVTVFLSSVLSVLVASGPCNAQSTASSSDTSLIAADDSTPESAADAKLVYDPVSPEAQAQPSAAKPTMAVDNDDQWHINFVPYLWFPGMHGTVGAKGFDTSVHATATDVLSHFRFGLAGITEFRRNRFVAPVDFMWVRLGDDKSLPFPEVGANSADVRISELLLTPEVGYRVVDHDNLKIDGVTGFRYWHLGQSVDFSPNGTHNASAYDNWVDPLVGARIEAALSPKIVLNIMGDVGGWGVGSQLEYSATGLMGYRLNPKWLLQVGYRYLDVNYRSGGDVLDIAMPGIMFGATWKFK